MDRKPISGLSSATTVNGADSMVIVQDSTTKQAPVSLLMRSLGGTVDSTFFGEGATGINAAIADRSAAGGGYVRVPESVSITAKISGADNVRLEIPGGVTLSIVADLGGETPAVDYGATTNFGIMGGGALAVQGNAKYALWAAGATSPAIDGLTVTGWRYGLFWASSATAALTKARVRGLTLGAPHTEDVVFPFLISNRPSLNGPFVDDVRVEDCVCIAATAGAYSFSSPQTADQFTFQGVKNLVIDGLYSDNGGENAFTLAWGCDNVVARNMRLFGADAHGANVGAGSVPCDITNDSGTFVKGEAVAITDSADGGYAATGTIGHTFQDDGRLYLQSVSGEQCKQNSSGSTITVTGGTSGATAEIDVAYLTSNVSIEASYIKGNGLDADSVGGTYAGVYIQQAEDVMIECRVEDNPVGVYAAQSGFQQGANLSLSGNVVDFSLNGETYYRHPVRNLLFGGDTELVTFESNLAITVGPNQLTTPTSASTNSGSNNGSRFDTSGRLQGVANNAAWLTGNRTGTSTTALGHIFAMRKLGADVGGIGTAGLELPTFAVAGLPTASSFTRYVVHCSDGDAGSECLAISDGTDWKVLAAIGATVSAT